MRDSLRDILEGVSASGPHPPVHQVSSSMIEIVVRVAIADGVITDGEWDILLGELADGDETTVHEAVARCRKAFARRPADAVRETDLRMLADILSYRDARTAREAAEAVLDLAKTERAERRDRMAAGTYREAGAPLQVAPEDVVDPESLRALLRDIFRYA